MAVNRIFNRFYRRFVTEILRDIPSVAPKSTSEASSQLKDLYVGQQEVKLAKPSLEAPASNESACPLTHVQVSTPGGGTRYVAAPGSGPGFRRRNYI
jgi:hypothetical protein